MPRAIPASDARSRARSRLLPLPTPHSLLPLFLTLLGAAALFPRTGLSQAPTIDTVIVLTRNVFDSTEADRNVLFRIANGIRFRTRTAVVRREVLFRAGQPYDSALVAETRRNLRRLGIFREVTIDTIRIDGRLAAVVQTADGWTTSLSLNARSTGGEFSWSTNLTESNFLGLNTKVSAGYRDDPDRNAFSLEGRVPRAFGTRLSGGGRYEKLSDGRRGEWTAGVPFRAFGDRWSVEVSGEAARQRILSFRRGAGGVPDSLVPTTFQRRALVQWINAGFAPVAGPRAYLRVGLYAQLRREEFVLAQDTVLTVPDTLTAAAGPFVEWQRAKFETVTHYNGFAREEDVDLSTRILVVGLVAPTAFGYERSGFGSLVEAQTGIAFGRVFAKLSVIANGLFSGAGLDSGQVVGGLTIASRLIPRQATVLHVEAGAQDSPTPGKEFDLGDGIGPRAFGTHAFVGTRTVWGILEHRVFLFDQVLGLLGIGVAGFVDYGGAWYPDQPVRKGGDVGFGLRIGPTRATGANLGRFDLSYQFGDGADGWVFSFGRGYNF